MRNYILLFSLLFFIMGCEKEAVTTQVNCSTETVALLPGEEIIRINFYKELCPHPLLENASCMLVQQGEKLCSEEWSYFYNEIEGFQYEEGYVYELKVRVEEIENPPTDGSSLRYILVEVISKEQV